MKRPKQADTAEFKAHWVKAAVEGRLSGAGGRVVTPEERALSRLRAGHLRRRREFEIINKAAAYFAKDAL